MTRTLLIVALFSSIALAADTQPTQAELDKKFEQTMTNATLDGHFTLGDNAPPKADKYTITSATKIPFTDKWLITARIQYGDHDVTVPLPIPVKFAGDTPVISITDLNIPGLGTFTARVLIYDDHYAGTWSGGKDHGGHLYGKITHETATTRPATKAAK